VGQDRRLTVGCTCPAALDHRRFWEAMDRSARPQLKEIERRIVAHMVERVRVDLSGSCST
jgi:hypothetical protein